MPPEQEVLRSAREAIDRERRMLEQECRQFRAFREAVRLARPSSSGESDSGQLTTDLRETYRETVMSTPDYDRIYGETLAKHAENELSGTVARKLIEAAPLSGRLKRKLLVQTTAAIERRELLDAQLEREAEALKTAHQELREFADTVDELPDCTVRHGSMDTLIETWDRYDALDDRCQALLDRRQEQLDAADRALHVPDSAYALNEYVYKHLESQYPVLSAIAAVLDRIDDAKGDTTPHNQQQVLTDGEG